MSARLQLTVELPLAHFALDVRIESDAHALGVFGASGSGKTTLLEALAGWRRPRAGRIVVDGRVWFDAMARIDLPPAQRRIGFVPQDGLLFPHLDVRANVLAGSERGGRALYARAIEVLELAPLLEQYPRSLSGGERQRVTLARALCSGPALLLLDEPLAALDLALRRRILPWLVRVRERFDVPLLFVSHDATEVQALCDEVAVLDAGSVRALGPTSEVLRAAARGSSSFEHVLSGHVTASSEGTADVVVGSELVFRVAAQGARCGDEVLFALDSEDVLLATERVGRISARNVLPARVERIVEVEPATRVELKLGADGAGPPVSASLTSAAVRELELVPGALAYLVVKAQSCRVLATKARVAGHAALAVGGTISITP